MIRILSLRGSSLEDAHGQQRAQGCIECQTETRPPRRYSWITNEQVMEEVKDSVPDKAGDYEPKTSFEADDGKNQESAGN
jgi:hypothetical protein